EMKFVWALMPPWDNVWTRQNHFVTRLVGLGAEVLYVENPFAATTLLKQGHWPKLRSTFSERRPGLTIMTPPLLAPGAMHSDWIAGFNAARIARGIKEFTQGRGWMNYDCWCRVPLAQALVDHLRPARIFYDVTDDYRHFSRQPRVAQKLDA